MILFGIQKQTVPPCRDFWFFWFFVIERLSFLDYVDGCFFCFFTTLPTSDCFLIQSSSWPHHLISHTDLNHIKRLSIIYSSPLLPSRHISCRADSSPTLFGALAPCTLRSLRPQFTLTPLQLPPSMKSLHTLPVPRNLSPVMAPQIVPVLPNVAFPSLWTT